MNSRFTYLIIIILLVQYSCTSNQENGSDMLIFDPTKVDLSDIQLSDIADEIRYIQLDSSVLLPGFSKTVLFGDDFIVLSRTDIGTLKYDKNGKFIRKIGAIGGGPGEYDNLSSLVEGEIDKEIFIKKYSGEILTYSQDGVYLDKISLDFITDNRDPRSDIRSIYYFNDLFYVFNWVQPYYEQPYLWHIVDKQGKTISYKQDLEFESSPQRPGRGVSTYSLHNSSCNGESILYWNNYNDTIFKMSKDTIKPFALWAKGNFRMTAERVQDNDNSFYIPKYVYEMDNKIFFSMGVRSQYPMFFFYDKHTRKFKGTNKPIIDDINGGAPWRNSNFNIFRLNGFDYIRFYIQPYDLRDELIKSDTPKSRALAETIDDDGNPVLVLIRLKK